MKITEKSQTSITIPAQCGMTLEMCASSLTRGGKGKAFEAGWGMWPWH